MRMRRDEDRRKTGRLGVFSAKRRTAVTAPEENPMSPILSTALQTTNAVKEAATKLRQKIRGVLDKMGQNHAI
jgi:hypothetical protein